MIIRHPVSKYMQHIIYTDDYNNILYRYLKYAGHYNALYHTYHYFNNNVKTIISKHNIKTVIIHYDYTDHNFNV